MEQIMNYVKPELIVVAIVLYFCGMALKQTQVVKDNISLCFWGQEESFFVEFGFWQHRH